MTEPGQDAAGQGAAAGLSGGAQTQTQGQPASAGSAGSGGWTMPESYRGKSLEDVARMHDELSKKFGQQGAELGPLRDYATKASGFLGQWEPVLKQFNYDPQRLVQALEAKARQAAAQGDPQGAQQAQAAAQRAYADLIDPREQQQWIESHVDTRATALQGQFQQAIQALAQNGQGYFAQMLDLALDAVQKQFDMLPDNVRPKFPIQKQLQLATDIASGKHNPMEWAHKIMTAESPEAMQARMEKTIRERIAQEQKNAALTTSVGAGGAPRTAMRPVVPPEPNRPSPVQRRPLASQAKERFAKHWDRIVG